MLQVGQAPRDLESPEDPSRPRSAIPLRVQNPKHVGTEDGVHVKPTTGEFLA